MKFYDWGVQQINTLLFVAQKREGQEFIGFYVEEGTKDLFREYCQFIDSTMKDELERYIKQCLADPNFKKYLETKKKLREGK
jgi:hypothetical protein